MRYLVSPWHPGPWKHAITLVMWQATRNSRGPFWVPAPTETLMYMHLSSVQKYSCLLKVWGAAHSRTDLSALAPRPRPALHSCDHNGRVEAKSTLN